MGVTVINILFTAAGLLAGVVLGSRFRKVERPAESTPQPEPTEQPRPETQLHSQQKERAEFVEEGPDEADVVHEMLVRLQELTRSVQVDVGAHNTHIQEISEELTSVDGTEAEVIAAVEKLVEANESMQAQLDSAEERLEEQSREMEEHVREARTDALTSLINRRGFDDEMADAERLLRENQRSTCVLMIDVDHFKKFNDTYGHLGGDEVLKGVASVLRRTLTADEIICRYGGEEFAVIFAGCELETARIRGEQARVAIGKETFHFDGMDVRVSASAGLAQLSPEETAAAVVRRADEALYLCKKLGRDCGHWHDGQQSHPMSEQVGTITADVQLPTLHEGESDSDRDESFSGLSDPVSFRQDVDRRIAEYKRGGSPISLLLVEVDNYLVLLEEFGAGPVASSATAQFLRATMREMDHIARFMEAQFALLLPGACVDAASVVAERLRSAVERCNLAVGDETIQFTVSLAVVEACNQDDTQDLLDRAASSLARAQDTGGNCTFVGEANGEFNLVAKRDESGSLILETETADSPSAAV